MSQRFARLWLVATRRRFAAPLLRNVSLLQADWPKRVFKPACLGILNQRKPCCFASLCAGNFLGRYGGAIYGPAEPAYDDQDIAHNNLHGHIRGERSSPIEGALACAGYSQLRDPVYHPICRKGRTVDLGQVSIR
jgi:hypothetical protein